MGKRNVKVAVISDTHLGTYGCHAEELNKYLKSINPEILIINGDFIDIWQLSKSYFPDTHWKVIKRVINMMMKGTKVVYLTGNHDEALRRFSGAQMENFTLEDKLILELDGKKMWFFHGDVFDVTMRHSKWLAKIGGQGYDLLILINRFVNHILGKMGYEKISLSKKVKDSVKAAVKHISNFETTAAEIAIENKFNYVICGHIHEPVMRTFVGENGSVKYLNSGDWIENLTSLEYNDGEWSLLHYRNLDLENSEQETESEVLPTTATILELQTAFLRYSQVSKVG